jgi:hypothetical protein
MAGVVVPNFAKLVSSRPITVAPLGAINAGAIASDLGGLANIFAQNTQQKNQLLSVADAIAPSDPTTAAIIQSQANAISPFSQGKNNTIQQIAPLLELAASKQNHAAQLGLQQQELTERKRVDDATIAFKAAEEARINAQLNAPAPTLGPVGSVTVSGEGTTPAFFRTGIDSDASQTVSATGGPGVLPALPGAVSVQSKTYGPQADPKALMNQALDLYDDSYANHQKLYGRSPSESLELADAADKEYQSADQINQMQGRIEQLYGSTSRDKASPQAPQTPLTPKDPYAWDNIPDGGMATKVLTPDLAVRRRKSGDTMIEQDVEIKNGKQYVGPDRVIKPMNKDGQQSVTPVDLPDGSQVVHVVFADGKTHDLNIKKPSDANVPTVQSVKAPDGQSYNVVSVGDHHIIQASTEVKNAKAAAKEIAKVNTEIAEIKRKMISADDEEKSAYQEELAAKMAYSQSLQDGLRQIDPASTALPDNKPSAAPAVPAESLTERLNKLKGLLK